MFSEPVISTDKVSKCYQIYEKSHDRLKQAIWRGRKQFYRSFHALRETSVEIGSGEIVGIIGANGAGKTTLLQLISGTLTPSTGSVRVSGRVAPLLALGAGFNPEFTGRENVYLNAAILGLTHSEIEAAYDSIIDFSEIGEFIDQPVKTYSSGMYARLAFAVATNINPDILIVDEVLSVGDGAFSRKSFNRIMSFKREGKTILFCSHSLYQVEALCSRVIWLDKGQVQFDGKPGKVVAAYSDFLDQETLKRQSSAVSDTITESLVPAPGLDGIKRTRITAVHAQVDGVEGNTLTVESRHSELSITVSFASAPDYPSPSIAVTFSDAGRRFISSASSKFDKVILKRDEKGNGSVGITFPKFPLLKGNYGLDVYLMSENGVGVLDKARNIAELIVVQDDLVQGIVSFTHKWNQE